MVHDAVKTWWITLLTLFTSGLPHQASSKRTPECIDTYRELYREPVTEMRLVFGYKDARPARFVGDRYERAWVIARLLREGFYRGEENELRAEVSGLDGVQTQIRLRIVNSSVGPDDEANRLDPRQAWQSARAARTFNEGLRGAKVVIYDGHSRTGGGPDFTPPRLTQVRHVDYAWYQNHRLAYLDLKKVLSRHAPALLGLLSCQSERHFDLPTRGLVASADVVYYAEAIRSAVEIFKSLREMRCPPNFAPEGTRLNGFFKEPSPKNSRRD